MWSRELGARGPSEWAEGIQGPSGLSRFTPKPERGLLRSGKMMVVDGSSASLEGGLWGPEQPGRLPGGGVAASHGRCRDLER